MSFALEEENMSKKKDQIEGILPAKRTSYLAFVKN